jgi:hypothetical protein
MTTEDMAREKRLRHAAARQGLRLSKSTRRDDPAGDRGRYRLSNPNLEPELAAGGSPPDYTLDLDGVEDVLFPYRHGAHDHPLARDEDFENAITPHAPHDGNWPHHHGT